MQGVLLCAIITVRTLKNILNIREPIVKRYLQFIIVFLVDDIISNYYFIATKTTMHFKLTYTKVCTFDFSAIFLLAIVGLATGKILAFPYI